MRKLAYLFIACVVVSSPAYARHHSYRLNHHRHLAARPKVAPKVIRVASANTKPSSVKMMKGDFELPAKTISPYVHFNTTQSKAQLIPLQNAMIRKAWEMAQAGVDKH